MGKPSKDYPWLEIFRAYDIFSHDFDEAPLLFAIERLEEDYVDAYEVEDSSDGQTLMHTLASNGRVELLRQLIERDPRRAKILDRDFNIPLEAACISGQSECVEALLTLELETHSLETLYAMKGADLAQHLKDLCRDSNFKEDVNAAIDAFFRSQVGEQLYAGVALEIDYDSDEAGPAAAEGAGLSPRQLAF